MLGPNLTKFATLGAFLRTSDEPYLIIGDFNMPPGVMIESGWPANVGAQVIVPSNTSYTCNVGSRRMLDYILVGNGAEDWVASDEEEVAGWTEKVRVKERNGGRGK